MLPKFKSLCTMELIKEKGKLGLFVGLQVDLRQFSRIFQEYTCINVRFY